MSRAISYLLLLLVVPGAWAQNEAGRTVFVAGTVTAEREETVALVRDDPVFEQDVIVTAERSRAQLLMRDGAKVALRPESRFRIEEYFLAGDERESPDGSIVVTTDDSVVTELIKGGFRTITGAVGRADPEDYRVETPAATMGIRGTHYSVVWCAGDCDLPPGVAGTRRIPDGLYVGVAEGIVYIVNNAGELLLEAGEYAYVRDRDTPPRRLRELPPALIDLHATDVVGVDEAAVQLRDTIRAIGSSAAVFGLAAGGAGEETVAAPRPGATAPRPTAVPPMPDLAPPVDDSSADGFDAEPERPVLLDDGQPITDGQLGEIRSVSLVIPPPAAADTFTAASPQGLRSFIGNDLSAFDAPFAGGGEARYAIGTAAVADDGFDPVSGFGWGRWTGGTATVTPPSGADIALGLGEQSLHWIYGPQLATRPAMPLTGIASFGLLVGNTDPTDTLGNTGILGNATLTADFTSATVQSTLLLGIGGTDWQASGGGTLDAGLFGGSYDTIRVGGQAGGSGRFSGFFGTPDGAGFPSAAGLTYGLTGPLGVTVSGAVIFGPPTIEP